MEEPSVPPPGKTRKKKTSRNENMPVAIADDLRKLITRGTLPPGLQLRQMELARRYNSSRVPLREALKILNAEGIINHDQNRGFFVAPLSSDEARQLHRIRHLLEAELLRTIEWPTDKQLASLRKQFVKLETALKKQDTTAWLDEHRKFYEAIFNLSPEKILVKEVLRMMRLMDRYRSMAAYALPDSERHAEQERKLLEVLANRNRKQLLQVFEKERARIEKGQQKVLKDRGY